MPEKVFVDKSTFTWYDTSHLLIYQHLRRSHHAAALRDLYRSIRRIKAEEMSEFHLKGPHVSCLYYLTQLGPLTAGQLCDRCEEDKAAVSRSLEYLEQNGYVTRPDKRYRSPLTLTEKGQETGRAIAGKIDRLVEAASEGLTPEQRQVMYDALTCISGHLERLAAPRKSQNGETDL